MTQECERCGSSYQKENCPICASNHETPKTVHDIENSVWQKVYALRKTAPPEDAFLLAEITKKVREMQEAGKHQEAAALCRLTLAQDPCCLWTHYNLILSLTELGRRLEAKEYLIRALPLLYRKENQRLEIHLAFAQILERMEKPSEAVLLFADVLRTVLHRRGLCDWGEPSPALLCRLFETLYTLNLKKEARLFCENSFCRPFKESEIPHLLLLCAYYLEMDKTSDNQDTHLLVRGAVINLPNVEPQKIHHPLRKIQDSPNFSQPTKDALSQLINRRYQA